MKCLDESGKPFAAAIFDMDGVIIDSEIMYLREYLEMSQEFGMGLTEQTVFDLVGGSNQEFKRALVSWWAAAGRTYTEAEAEAAYHAWAEPRGRDYRAIMNPGVFETLTDLKLRGIRLALASSSPMDNICEVLDACGLVDMFEIVVSGDDFEESKPNPAVYLHAVEKLGLKPGACCCIEDSVPGITAGKRAGLTVIAKREERFGFSQDEADLIIDEIPDLLQVL
ncbi:HAD family phosphatase [Collinsella sp. AGMB00827]|uniref:HAD family phosphatase n=2 Tax=Collinsella ureilytica TaxID=2869515 RepID=A0ABS7MLD5_9ACTN|nr:HAD family phosphatase [Collinsella urealyticum]